MSHIYTVVRCPRCGKPVPWNETQSFRPFCSERCRLIDLGSWANEDYAIPGEPIGPAEPSEDRNGTEEPPAA
ncbi:MULTISPECIES: DNA gyrase inhibitor YacG [Methylococcus]|uniref:DNA gyrase inhibitor YacG n=1 Tax=Methylococcus TaxID=413 RepID=UPI001C52C033|nr:DNA gyrase inhibitor YacG [Methylococcus capsulatus]QXP91352.1 DNA gyrase inhibitor YacG [Methylococcus capsulatus]